MDGMPRPRPPFLQREVTRHGAVTWVVRVGKGPRIRIKQEYGTPEFEEAYRAALEGKKPAKPGPASGSLEWLLEKYRASGAWTGLSMATRRQRENIFRHVLETAGKDPFIKITESTIEAGKDRRSSTPAQARNFLDAMRGLFKWAKGAGHVKVDPTASITNPRSSKGDGFVPWSEDDVATYEARWPVGTKERVWLDVLLYTGLRRGDAVRLGKQHVREETATLKTEKSQGEIEVTLPILPVLAATLKAGPIGDLAFIVGENRKPLTKESFGNYFSAAAREAGIRKSAHGVRKIAATRAANAGATVAQLEAIFGWVGGQMASLYTRKADRKRLAKDAMHKLGGPGEAETAQQIAKKRL